MKECSNFNEKLRGKNKHPWNTQIKIIQTIFNITSIKSFVKCNTVHKFLHFLWFILYNWKFLEIYN